MRALSVIGVVLFHMGLLWCGWMGVWVFFVISGFVITRSLLRAPPLPWRQRLRAFYVARASRILPLYLAAVVVAVATLCVQAALYDQPDEFRFLWDLPWLLSGTYNLYRVLPDYEQTQLFGHLWSLSVEEQFYALFPLAFLLMSRGRLTVLLVVLVAAGPLVRVVSHASLSGLGWSQPEVATGLYMLSFNHFDAFAAGCLMAMRETSIRNLRGTRWNDRLALSALAVTALLAVACVFARYLDGPTEGLKILTTPFLAKPDTLAGQVAVYAFATSMAVTALVWTLLERPITALLRGDWLVRVGGLSFGIYVWHFPLLWIFTEAGVRSWQGALAYWFAVWVVATLSYRLMEAPLRDWIRSGVRPSSLSPTSVVRSPVLP